MTRQPLQKRGPLGRWLGRARGWVVEAPVGTARYWICLVFLVSRLAPDLRSRLALVLRGLGMPTRDRLNRGSADHSRRIRLAYGGRRLDWWVGPRSDLEVLNEVLVHDVYRVEERPRTVLDLGSHIGASVLAFRTAFPGAEIAAVEPDPRSFARLRRNTQTLPGIRLFPVAVASYDGQATLAQARQPWLSALGSEGVTVEARTLETLLDGLGWATVDLLKIDIEGSEAPVLRSPAMARVRAIVGEIHDDLALADLPGFEVELSGGQGRWYVRATAHDD